MVRTSIFGCLLASATMMAAVNAVAEPAYTPDDIVKFFTASADMGAARALCVGTESECRSEAAPTPGFDMLVSFDLDSAILTPAAQENLGQFAVALRDDRLAAARFVVEGHSDATGPDTYNQNLSEARAASVRAFLLSKGVTNDKLDIVGLGESAPRTDDPFAAENRRVEMKIQLQ